MKDDSLKQAYQRAGSDFLALDLVGMFRHLETPEDIALHNAIQCKVFKMIGDDKVSANAFYRALSHKLLAKRAKKSFIKRVCEVLIGERN